MGSKLNEDLTEFYELVKNNIAESKFEETKDILLDFISKHPAEVHAINLYLECLIELKQFEEAESFIESLEKHVQENDEIQQAIKKIKIVKSNLNGPDIEDLLLRLEKKPTDIDLIIEVSDKYFSIQQYDNCMELLLKNYPKNKNKIKEKMIEFFEVLGNSNEHTINYRKKLSQIMFS